MSKKDDKNHDGQENNSGQKAKDLNERPKLLLFKLTANGASHYYHPIPTGYPPGPANNGPTHYHAMPSAHLQAPNTNAATSATPLPSQQQVPPNGTSPQAPSQQQNIPHSPSPPNNNYHKDERSQRQHNKLLRKLEKQRELNSSLSTPPPHSPSPRRSEINGHHNHANVAACSGNLVTTSINNNQQPQFHSHAQQTHSVQHQVSNNHPRRSSNRNNNGSGHNSSQQQIPQQRRSGCPSSQATSEDGEDSCSNAPEDEEDYQSMIIEQLSSIQKPEVIDITSSSAKIIWEAPKITDQSYINTRDLRYNVLLSDRAKECKYKSLYKGESHDCIVQDLQPGQEYVVRLQVHYAKLQGDASEPTEFTTPACVPDQPLPPKLAVRTKNSLQLRWGAPAHNGSPILHYILEYDEGKSGGTIRGSEISPNGQQVHFVEITKTKSKHYTVTKLQHSTVYNFRLAAVNEVGASPYSHITPFSTAGNPPTAPKPPTLDTATVTSSSMRLYWERRSQDVDFVLQMLDRESGHGYLNVYNGPENSYECRQLRRATGYKFRLRSENDAGPSPWSNEVTFETAPERPGRPGKPYVKGKIHGTFFKARWDKPSDTGGADITHYYLEINAGPKFECIYMGPEPETTCDRLTPGTTYQLRASCEGPAGISAYSEVAHITSEAVVPVAPPPPYYSDTPAPYAAVLRFHKPDYNGGAPILEYELQLRPAAKSEGQNQLPNSIYRGKDSYCVVDHLKPGHSYEVQVRAINRIGAGPWSSWFRFTTAAAPPQTPSAPKVVVKSATHIIISWQPPDGNGAAITEYRLENATVAIDTIDVNFEATIKPPASSTFQTCYQGLQLSADLRNLMPYTVYFFRLNASNIAGVSNWSPLVQAKTPAAVPAAPQIKDYEFTANEVSLRWTQPECNGSPIIAYNIECGDRLIATPDSTNEYTITELQPETTYKIRVQAINNVGVGHFSPFEKLTTLPSPPVPPTLECTGVGHNFIKLKWGDGKNLDFTKYYVEMYVQRAKQFQEVYSGTNTMCKVNKLQERTAYTFRICASNDRAGTGEYSEEYVFTTNASLPSNIKAPRVACEGAFLLGSNPGNLEVSGILPEGPSSLPQILLCVPVTLEWQHSKNSFQDRVEYELQYAIGKENDFKKIYRGTETKFTINNLEPGNVYQFRVCPIRVTSAGEDLPGQFTSAFRYQAPAAPYIDELDANVINSAAAAGVFAVPASGASNNRSSSNLPCHGHSHHAHHAHHSHNHSHNHHSSQHNSRHNGSSSTSNTASSVHHRSVSASAVSSSSGSSNNSNSKIQNSMIFGQNTIGLIPIGPAMANELANMANCSDPNHHHHHHHHHHPFHGTNSGDNDETSMSTTASFLAAASAGGLIAGNSLFTAAAAAAAHHQSHHHHQHNQNAGAIRRFVTKISSMYSNRKRFTDRQKAGIFLVSFFFCTFLFATLVRMFMR